MHIQDINPCYTYKCLVRDVLAVSYGSLFLHSFSLQPIWRQEYDLRTA